MKVTICLLILVHLLCIEHGSSYPNGAPASTCGTMMPTHGVSSQACSIKYKIQADKQQFSAGETVRITVNGSTSTDLFRGILLIAKTSTGDQIVGTWTTVDSLTQTLACNSVANTGITQKSDTEKSSIVAVWTPPATVSGPIVIKATMVTSKNVIYVNCFSITLTARQGNQSTNGTTGTTTAAPGSNNTSSSSSSSSTVAAVTTTTTTVPESDQVVLHVNWTYANGVTTVRMRANNLKAGQWSAFGLSIDQEMGDDHVFVCKHLADDNVLLERRTNPGGYSAPTLVTEPNSLGGRFTVLSQRVENGIVSCQFTLSGFTRSQRQLRAAPTLSSSASYYPLVAVGNLDSSGGLIQHTARASLDRTVQLNREESFGYDADDSGRARMVLMKAHGIIMIFTWMLLVSTGVLIARHFKTALPTRKICGEAPWFAVHRAVMVSVAILTIIAFILILVYKRGAWISRREELEFAHSIVGILVVCFAIIQPLMALFRCHPGTPYRFIFNYLHMGMGLSALILSIVAIFLAMFFEDFDFKENKEWGIILAWTLWLPLIFIAFQMIEVYFKRQMSDKQTADSYDLGGAQRGDAIAHHPPNEPARNPLHDRVKAIALAVHILVASGLSVALTIVIRRA